MLRRWTVLASLAAALVLLAGCNGGGNADLQKSLDELASENKRLNERVDKLTKDLRPLEKKVHEIDESNRHLEKAIVQAADDLRSRIHEMVQQERSGRRGRFVRPAPAVPERAAEPEVPRPYLGFDGQTVTDELVKELKLKATKGVVATALRDGAPAQVAGLKKDDVVQTLDGIAIGTKTELVAALAKKKPGDIITIAGVRGDDKFEFKIKLGRR